MLLFTKLKLFKIESHIGRKGSDRRCGLYIFYLPTYSPELNIAETMWRHLKGGWIKPEDYFDNDSLAYALNRCMSNIGISLKIDFKPFNEN